MANGERPPDKEPVAPPPPPPPDAQVAPPPSPASDDAVLAGSFAGSADSTHADASQVGPPEKVHRGPRLTAVRIAIAAGIVILVVLVAGLAFHFLRGGGSVSANPQEDIVGSWQCNDGLELTFPSAHEMTYSTTGGSIETSGTATSDTGAPLVSEDGDLIGAWEFSISTYSVEIRGDTMELKSSGRSYTCTRQ